MSKVKRILRDEFLEARLGYIAELTDRGCSPIHILGCVNVCRDAQVEGFQEEIRDRDRDAALEAKVQEHAICLYQVYRTHCQRNITLWHDCTDQVKDRWREIARASLRHGKRLAYETFIKEGL